MGVETIVYRVLARKPEGNRPFSRLNEYSEFFLGDKAA
jgi:hypothetical protein